MYSSTKTVSNMSTQARIVSDEKYIEGPKVLFKKGKYQALEFDYNNLHFILVCIQKFSLLHAVNDYTLYVVVTKALSFYSNLGH